MASLLLFTSITGQLGSSGACYAKFFFFFRNGWMLKSFNQTYISLILKEKWGLQFQPILTHWCLQCVLQSYNKNPSE